MTTGKTYPRPVRVDNGLAFVVIGGRRLPIEWADGVAALPAGHSLHCRKTQAGDGRIEFRLYSADPAQATGRLVGYAAPAPNGVGT